MRLGNKKDKKLLIYRNIVTRKKFMGAQLEHPNSYTFSLEINK